MELYEYIKSFLQDSVGSFLSTVPPVYFLSVIALSSVFIKRGNSEIVNSVIVIICAFLLGFLACWSYPDEFFTPEGVVSLMSGLIASLLVVKHRKWLFGLVKRKRPG